MPPEKPAYLLSVKAMPRECSLCSYVFTCHADGAKSNIVEESLDNLWIACLPRTQIMTYNTPSKNVVTADRSSLAWHSVSDAAPTLHETYLSTADEIVLLMPKLRTQYSELKSLAEDNNLIFRSLPRTFEVRWTQFTADIVKLVLTSWHVLTIFFQKSDDRAAKGYLNFLTNYDNLKLLTVISRHSHCLLEVSKTPSVRLSNHFDVNRSTSKEGQNLQHYQEHHWKEAGQR
jgi:hypothetical protein